MGWGWDLTSTAAREREGDWFGGRRDHFVRQVLDETLRLVVWFQHLYDLYRDGYLHGASSGNSRSEPRPETVLVKLSTAFSDMVGTEKNNGPLWQLKDLCHQLWPHARSGQSIHGILFDWLIGSLFHECMKLKENLYLLNNYGARTATVDSLVEQIGLRQMAKGGSTPLEDIRMLIGQVTGDVTRQMERVGFLFGQVSYFLRLMLPALIDNRLVVRLLVEEEEILAELWGETLEELFAGICSGGAAAGFCLAGESFFQGQWYEQALRLYERALAYDRCCNEAVVRAVQLKAIIGNDRKVGQEGNQVHHP